MSDNSQWISFLQERYDGGHAMVPNPNPDANVRKKFPKVKLNTALKDPGVASKVQREFQEWKAKGQEAPAEHNDTHSDKDKLELVLSDLPALSEDDFDKYLTDLSRMSPEELDKIVNSDGSLKSDVINEAFEDIRGETKDPKVKELLGDDFKLSQDDLDEMVKEMDAAKPAKEPKDKITTEDFRNRIKALTKATPAERDKAIDEIVDRIIALGDQDNINTFFEGLTESDPEAGSKPLNPDNFQAPGSKPLNPKDFRSKEEPKPEPEKPEEPRQEEPKKEEEPVKQEEPKKEEEPKQEEPKKEEEPKLENSEDSKEPKQEEPTKEEPEHPQGWRSSDDEPELTDDNQEDWLKEHQASTPNGSVLLGTAHVPDVTQQTPESDVFNKHIIPKAIEAAEKAIKEGKHVVFLGEGESFEGDALDTDETWNEQHAVAKALNKKFGDKVHQGTWDDDAVEVFDPKSPVWDTLTKAAGGDKTKAQAAIAIFMIGQDGHLGMLRDSGVLTPESETAVWLQTGVDLSQPLSDEDRGRLYKEAFPKDFGEGENQISLIGEVYNAARQANLLKKIKQIEADGGVAIVTPGASHAWNLKPVLEPSVKAQEPETPEQNTEEQEQNTEEQEQNTEETKAQEPSASSGHNVPELSPKEKSTLKSKAEETLTSLKEEFPSMQTLGDLLAYLGQAFVTEEKFESAGNHPDDGKQERELERANKAEEKKKKDAEKAEEKRLKDIEKKHKAEEKRLKDEAKRLKDEEKQRLEDAKRKGDAK